MVFSIAVLLEEDGFGICENLRRPGLYSSSIRLVFGERVTYNYISPIISINRLNCCQELFRSVVGGI